MALDFGVAPFAALRPTFLALMLLMGSSGSAIGNPHHATMRRRTIDPFLFGAAAPIVLKAIRAAEAGDSSLFNAQLNAQILGRKPKMSLIDLRPKCVLISVTQASSIAVTAKWTCRAGKVDAIATRDFVISHGKIAAITGEPVPEYHFVQ